MRVRFLSIVITFLLSLLNAQAQLSVTFRYVKTPEDNFVRVFVPGEMNNWAQTQVALSVQQHLR